MRYRNTTWATVSLILLVAGVAIGVYYQREIMVWVYALLNREQASEMAAMPSIAPETSTLKIPQLDEPVPLVFSETLNETTIQEELKEGAVVLPLGTVIGQPGNVVITAHSTGLTTFGPYRFAFAKISELKNGDEFSIKTPKATYTYKIFSSEIVWPTQVDKLPQGDKSTVTLVTCWPLWTNFKRLLVNGELVRVSYQ